jgi:hypothetical protein
LTQIPYVSNYRLVAVSALGPHPPDPTDFKRALPLPFSADTRQHDAQELLSALLPELALGHRLAVDGDREGDEALHQACLFEAKERSELRPACACDVTSATTQDMGLLALALPPPNAQGACTLEACLQLWGEWEKLDLAEQTTCPNCGVPRTHKTLTVTVLPDVLVLHLTVRGGGTQLLA